MSGVKIGSEESEPTENAMVSIRVESQLDGSGSADVRFAGNPTYGFTQLVILAIAGIGLAVGPALTAVGLSPGIPPWAIVTVLLGHMAVLLVLAWIVVGRYPKSAKP